MEVKEAPPRTSGAVKALKSCSVTYSSVKEMLPEGMSRRDQGEMMKPMFVGGFNTGLLKDSVAVTAPNLAPSSHGVVSQTNKPHWMLAFLFLSSARSGPAREKALTIP
ncbi:hypothetical protein EYF80_036428 [Liparis tanakae]|uniref:Uncharacterized protein n=1 Tax=Liparis tanakae TaxID=230148 RepID=A0A4Z2GJH8_9TELE|nr:hypothetical protein EYF80_036428 [Liparis tanakae]